MSDKRLTGINRRSLLLAGVGAATAAALPKSLAAQTRRASWDVVVVGAGVFGAWTARKLQILGRRVLLVDAWSPAHARASSGGESLVDWRALSARAGLPIFHETGVLFFFPENDPFLGQTMAVHRRLGLPTQLLDTAAMRRRFPQIDFNGIAAGLFEPRFGALMARRAVQTLVAEFIRAGGEYRQARIETPTGRSLSHVTAETGERFQADRFVFACGPWLGRVFPDLLGRRIFPTRQEVFFFAPRPGDDRFETLRPGPGDGLLSVDLGTQRADVGKLPVALGVVEPVAHDEDARDVEPLVPDRDLNLRRLGLAQQREHLERGRLA